MFEPIKIKKAAKKINGKWINVSRKELTSEDDIDGLIIVTESGRMFKIIEKRENS